MRLHRAAEISARVRVVNDYIGSSLNISDLSAVRLISCDRSSQNLNRGQNRVTSNFSLVSLPLLTHAYVSLCPRNNERYFSIIRTIVHFSDFREVRSRSRDETRHRRERKEKGISRYEIGGTTTTVQQINRLTSSHLGDSWKISADYGRLCAKDA